MTIITPSIIRSASVGPPLVSGLGGLEGTLLLWWRDEGKHSHPFLSGTGGILGTNSHRGMLFSFSCLFVSPEEDNPPLPGRTVCGTARAADISHLRRQWETV